MNNLAQERPAIALPLQDGDTVWARLIARVVFSGVPKDRSVFAVIKASIHQTCGAAAGGR